MKKLLPCAAFGLLLILAPRSPAQAVAGAADAATSAAAPASGLVGLCQMIEAKLAACKAKICACPLGQMLTNGQSVGNLFLGGMCCPPCCPPVNPNDLKQPSDSLAGACARFKQDQLTMPARRNSVRCLAYADCHWWPEAQVALLTALRTDKNECVRLEAARVLCTGCCCTAKVIETLAIVVSGSTRDGNPSENSPRVKTAALKALEHCVHCYSERLPEPERPERPEKAPLPKKVAAADDRIQPVAAEEDPLAKAVAYARRVLADAKRQQPAPVPGTLETGQQGLFHIAAVTFNPPPLSARPPTREPQLDGPVSAADPQTGVPPAGSRSLFEVARIALHRQPVPEEQGAEGPNPSQKPASPSVPEWPLSTPTAPATPSASAGIQDNSQPTPLREPTFPAPEPFDPDR